jgi:hypothetical protein
MTVATHAGRVSDVQPEVLVERAAQSSSDERNERLLWLYSMNEYLSTRGTNAEVESAMKKFSMAQWDSNPSRNDFTKMFHIAIASLRKSVETKLIQPLEKTLDKEEERRIQLKREAASSKRKSGRKAKD